jgi:anti-anti-sigma factor
LAQPISPFRCEAFPDRDQVVVVPSGELDMSTVGVVEQELRALRSAGFDSIVLDLSRLTFMDSTGLHLAVRWARAAEGDGFRFELEPGPRAVQRVFALAQLTDELPFRQS